MSSVHNNIFSEIRQTVKQIPFGYVSTYGNVATALNLRDVRLVGWALHGNQDPSLPCHRVVKKDGHLASNYSLGGWQEQARRLQKEQVFFLKPNQVDLAK